MDTKVGTLQIPDAFSKGEVVEIGRELLKDGWGAIDDSVVVMGWRASYDMGILLSLFSHPIPQFSCLGVPHGNRP